MTEHPDHLDHIAICPHCQGLAVTHFERVGDVASGRMTFGDGSSMVLSGGALYLGSVLGGCSEGPSVTEQPKASVALFPYPSDQLSAGTCAPCERCTWNPGPDCGRVDHPHCPTCGHCQGRHAS